MQVVEGLIVVHDTHGVCELLTRHFHLLEARNICVQLF